MLEGSLMLSTGSVGIWNQSHCCIAVALRIEGTGNQWNIYDIWIIIASNMTINKGCDSISLYVVVVASIPYYWTWSIINSP